MKEAGRKLAIFVLENFNMSLIFLIGVLAFFIIIGGSL